MSDDVTCSAEGCVRPPRRRSAAYCHAHYWRIRRTGNLGSAPVREGWRQGVVVCSLPDCNKATRKGALICSMHQARLARHGSYDVVLQCGDKRDPSEPPSYETTHARLRTIRGVARQHQCISCGAAAADWAYQHNDPNERISDGTKFGYPYSVDLNCYEPMCKKCHNIFDGRTKRAKVESGGTR